MANEERQIREAEIFNEQCFLLENFKKLSSINIRTTNNEPYKNFTMIEGDPGIIVHELVGKKGVENILELTPAQKALLVPRIQLFKVSYEGENKKGKDLEIVFRDHISQDSIENIHRNRNARGDDVGIQNFSYELAGKNLAEGGLAKCTLTLYFRDVNSLLSGESTNTTARFLDLLIPESKFIRQKDENGRIIPNSRIWNSKSFRLKAIVGWAVPSDPQQILINKKLKKAIENSKTILFLTLIDHELDFREDGSLLVTINYQGAIESAITSNSKSDILSLSSAGKLSNKLRQKEKERQIRIQKKNPSKEPKITSIHNKDSVVIGDDPKKDELELLEILRLESLDKQIRYSKIIDALHNNGRMYFVNVEEKHFRSFVSFQKARLQQLKSIEKKDSKTEAEIERIKRNLVDRTSINMPGIKVHKILPKDKRLLPSSRALKTISKANDLRRENLSSIISSNGVKYQKRNREQVSKIVYEEFEQHAHTWSVKNKNCPECKKVNYFYFGDLLEIVFNVLTDPSRDDVHNMRILLGSMIFRDPRFPDKKDPVILNLADIPISLNLFLSWYLDKVVKPQRERYFLDEFVKDAIQTLIIPALGENCFVGASNQKVNISMNFFTVPGKGTGGEIEPIPTKIPRIDLLQLKNTSNGNIFSQDSEKEIPELYHYLYIYVSNQEYEKLSGDILEDTRKGIYHFNIGSNVGLIKSIKFKKIDQPYVAAMRATQDSDDVKRLRDRYNATIIMIGNNLFRPGMYVYINTNTIGLGDSTSKNSVSSLLGLGGYYQVRKVNQDTDKNNYETQLDCQWIFSGRDENSQKPIKSNQNQNMMKKRISNK